MRRSMAILALLLLVGCSSAVDPNVVVVDQKTVSSSLELIEKYPTKTVEFSGVIDTVGVFRESESMSAVFLKPQSVGTMCPIHEPQVWAKLAPGQAVTLRGKKFDDMDFAWKVHKAEPNPCPALTSTSFAQEFEDSPAESHDKYNNKSFYLTGKVIAIEPWETHHFLIKLEGSRDWSIDLQVNMQYEVFVKQIKPEQTISALCTYTNGYFQPDVHTSSIDANPITIKFPVAGIEYRKSLPTADERDAEVAAKMRQAKPDFNVAIAELLKPDSEVIPKYKGKIVEVSGTISRFDFEDGHPQIRLKNADQPDGDTLTVHMADSAPWSDYIPGQQVTIRGLFPEESYSISLQDAVVLKGIAASRPMRKLTAVELAKACPRADDAFEKDWHNGYVKVQGKLLERSPDLSASVVDLDGGNGYPVRVLLESERHGARKRLASLKPGTVVECVAKFFSTPDDDLLILNEGWIVNTGQ